ncbi:MAG: glycine zipper family protein [Deltaproteobacteria bacterium]|nr:glycine zipper family protein [Deltaproteobacteria bacterium]
MITTTLNRRKKLASKVFFPLLILMVISGLSACYHQNYSSASYPAPYPEAETVEKQSTVLTSQVYFYPKKEQTTEQQSRDHYECYNWAVEQTGFDPGQSPIPKQERVRVVPMPPPGYDTATMAIAGAVLGALIGGPRHAAEGALIGASGGAIAGAASDAARQQQAQQMEDYYASRNQSDNAQLSKKVSDFRRAMGACLEGRGYSVR